MYNTNNLADMIKTIAKERKISITTLLEDCGLNKNTLSTMVSRGSWIQANSLALIADRLNTSLDKLMGRKTVNSKEQQLLELYNAHPELQLAVDRILGIKENTESDIASDIVDTINSDAFTRKADTNVK